MEEELESPESHRVHSAHLPLSRKHGPDQGKAQAHNRRGTNLDLYLFLLLNPADLSGEGRSLDDTEYGVDEEERNDSIKLRKAGETSD